MIRYASLKMNAVRFIERKKHKPQQKTETLQIGLKKLPKSNNNHKSDWRKPSWILVIQLVSLDIVDYNAQMSLAENILFKWVFRIYTKNKCVDGFFCCTARTVKMDICVISRYRSYYPYYTYFVSTPFFVAIEMSIGHSCYTFVIDIFLAMLM